MDEIILKLKNGSNYVFMADMFEPQYSHSESVHIKIKYELAENSFIYTYNHFRHTKTEKFDNETITSFTELEIREKLKNIKPEFWGQGFWSEEDIINSLERIVSRIS